jgi:hypothetical protein
MRADVLTDEVAGLDDAIAVLDACDRTLVDGLLHPHPAQIAALTELANGVAGTPLADQVAEAVEKMSTGGAGEDHFVVLAAARTALLGSVHDALLAQLDEATGRTRPQDVPVASGAEHEPNLLAAARSWLSDLARAGWQGLDHELVSDVEHVVSSMLPDPALRRLAVLLDGFAAELAACCPGSRFDRFPLRRWADLWSRAMVLTLSGATDVPAAEPVSGRVLPLGVDVHEHTTAVQAQVHAVFEPADGGPPRLVRASASAPKPDTVVGAGLWQLLRPHLSLLAAVSEGRAMDVEDMPLTAEGDLLWSDEHARLGEVAEAFTTARVLLPTAIGSATAPLNRHPATIAEPVFLEHYTVDNDDDQESLTFTVAGARIAVDADRAPVAGPLTAEAVATSSACLGLLRWDDGRFVLQPLAVETNHGKRKKPVAVHAGAWAGGTTDKNGLKVEKAATAAEKALRERAGRLLRS